MSEKIGGTSNHELLVRSIRGQLKLLREEIAALTAERDTLVKELHEARVECATLGESADALKALQDKKQPNPEAAEWMERYLAAEARVRELEEITRGWQEKYLDETGGLKNWNDELQARIAMLTKALRAARIGIGGDDEYQWVTDTINAALMEDERLGTK